jgi:hypothetical protein
LGRSATEKKMRVYAHILQPTYDNVCFILTELVNKGGYLPFDTVTVITLYSIVQTKYFRLFFEAIISAITSV